MSDQTPTHPGIDVEEEGDPEVPADLLNLGIDLDLAGVTPDEFAELFGGEQ